MNIFLIGYRCTGKTTVGQSIALMTGRPFVDSDTLVIEASGQSIKKIIDTEGWAAFRCKERSVMRRICSKDRQVVATGGGIVLCADNVEAMKNTGIIIWLRAAAQTIEQRILRDQNTGDLRPALTNKGLVAEIEEMLLKRSPYYESASNFFIHTDGIPVAEITQTIMHKIKDME
ncbi:MAG: shikimate kinase [Desulfobacterales bacterium]|nr:MAG: shikimate kinase [Desulfobacterales bacterium]